MIDWLLQQIHVAENIAAGIRDMRPRKSGPAYDVFMEWVSNRKRKAVAVHHWIIAAERTGRGAGDEVVLKGAEPGGPKGARVPPCDGRHSRAWRFMARCGLDGMTCSALPSRAPTSRPGQKPGLLLCVSGWSLLKNMKFFILAACDTGHCDERPGAA